MAYLRNHPQQRTCSVQRRRFRKVEILLYNAGGVDPLSYPGFRQTTSPALPEDHGSIELHVPADDLSTIKRVYEFGMDGVKRRCGDHIPLADARKAGDLGRNREARTHEGVNERLTIARDDRNLDDLGTPVRTGRFGVEKDHRRISQDALCLLQSVHITYGHLCRLTECEDRKTAFMRYVSVNASTGNHEYDTVIRIRFVLTEYVHNRTAMLNSDPHAMQALKMRNVLDENRMDTERHGFTFCAVMKSSIFSG